MSFECRHPRLALVESPAFRRWRAGLKTWFGLQRRGWRSAPVPERSNLGKRAGADFLNATEAITLLRPRTNALRCGLFTPALKWLSLAAWFFLLFTAVNIRADTADAVLDRWLAAQKNLTSWSADFVQTRHLKALVQPLTAPGRLWFVAPDKFRWELGSPVQSIALRADADLLVLAPKLKRAERYSLTELQKGPLKDALALLDTGFPREPADFRRRFNLLALTETNATYAFHLQPKAATVRRLLPELTVVVATNDFALAATELVFADGSRLRNDFTNAVKNPAVDAALFTPTLDATWKVTEPMKPQ